MITLQQIYDNPMILNPYFKNVEIIENDRELYFLNKLTGDLWGYYPYFPYNPYKGMEYMNQYELSKTELMDYINEIEADVIGA